MSDLQQLEKEVEALKQQLRYVTPTRYRFRLGEGKSTKLRWYQRLWNFINPGV